MCYSKVSINSEREAQADEIFGGFSLPAALNKEQEKNVLKSLNEGDSSARDFLIEHNLRLVVHTVRKFENTGMELEDLVSIGAIGLCKAVDSFNISYGTEFSTYAVKCIRNEILNELRPRSVKAVSLDEPFISEDGDECCLLDVIGTEKDMVENQLLNPERRAVLESAVDDLGDVDKTILTMFLGLDGSEPVTRRSIANRFGFSRQTACNHVASALRKLRNTVEGTL